MKLEEMCEEHQASGTIEREAQNKVLRQKYADISDLKYAKVLFSALE